MTQKRLAGIWKQIRGDAEELCGTLFDNPQLTAAGLRDQRAGKVQMRLAATQEHAARQLREFYERNRNWDLSSH